MRTYSVDNPEFFCFELDDGKAYKIPLITSMKNREIKAFNETGSDYVKQVEWLRGYIGDVVDDLTVPTTTAILRDWREQSESKGATLGES